MAFLFILQHLIWPLFGCVLPGAGGVNSESRAQYKIKQNKLRKEKIIPFNFVFNSKNRLGEGETLPPPSTPKPYLGV